MRRLPPRASLYVGKNVLLAIALVWAVMLNFTSVLDFASELGDVGKESYTLSHAVLYMLVTTPRRMYDIYPTSAVIGGLLALGALASKSELTALRAVGLSKLQIGLGALLPAVALMLLMVVDMETIGPAGEQRGQALVNAKSKQLSMARYSGLWAREGDLFFNARSGAPREAGGRTWIELQDVRLYQFDPDGKLLSLAHARTAEHRNDGWTLHEVQRTTFQDRGVAVEDKPTEHWKTELDDKALETTLARPRYLSAMELRSNIDYLRRNQLDAWKFEAAYWGRWFYPLKLIALCLATLPFAFGSLRSGGFGKRLFLGILIGIGYVLVEQLAVNLCDVYRYDVRWAYGVLPFALVGFCWGVLARRI